MKIRTNHLWLIAGLLTAAGALSFQSDPGEIEPNQATMIYQDPFVQFTLSQDGSVIDVLSDSKGNLVTSTPGGTSTLFANFDHSLPLKKTIVLRGWSCMTANGETTNSTAVITPGGKAMCTCVFSN